MQELLLTQDITIDSLVNLTEHRNQETGEIAHQAYSDVCTTAGKGR